MSEEIIRYTGKKKEKMLQKRENGSKQKDRSSIKKSRITSIQFCQGREYFS